MSFQRMSHSLLWHKVAPESLLLRLQKPRKEDGEERGICLKVEWGKRIEDVDTYKREEIYIMIDPCDGQYHT